MRAPRLPLPPRARRNRRIDRELKAAHRRTVFRAARFGVLVTGLGIAGYHGVRLADARGWLSIFRVREVRVVGAEVARPDILVAEAGLMGRVLHYWSPLGEYATRVERDPLVAEATLERRFPNRLVLEVTERRPIALLELDRLAPVDQAGRILPVSPFRAGWDVPILKVEWTPIEVATGGKVRLRAVRRMLAWLAQVDREYPALSREISVVELDETGTVTLHLVSAEGELVLDQSTPVEKLALVDDVLRDLREKGLTYMRLDLRFEDQIIVRRS